jgi:hypothetical protein
MIIPCAQKGPSKLNIVNKSMGPKNQLSTAQMYAAGMITGCPREITLKDITRCICNPGSTQRKIPILKCGSCPTNFPHQQIFTGFYTYFASRN